MPKLLKHCHPEYTPFNKNAKFHLRAIKVSDFKSFKEAPINFNITMDLRCQMSEKDQKTLTLADKENDV